MLTTTNCIFKPSWLPSLTFGLLIQEQAETTLVRARRSSEPRNALMQLRPETIRNYFRAERDLKVCANQVFVPISPSFLHPSYDPKSLRTLGIMFAVKRNGSSLPRDFRIGISNLGKGEIRMAYEERQAEHRRVVVETPTARREEVHSEAVHYPERSGVSGAALAAIVVGVIALAAIIILFVMNQQQNGVNDNAAAQ